MIERAHQSTIVLYIHLKINRTNYMALFVRAKVLNTGMISVLATSQMSMILIDWAAYRLVPPGITEKIIKN